jgi:hypothetical protein
MMQVDCEAAREQLDAWALGALDEDDARRVDQHLATCEACRSLADAARETAAAVALAVPVRSASASLKAKVMAGAAVLDDVPRSTQTRRRAWWPAAAAAVVAIGVGLVGWGAYNQNQIDDLEGQNSLLAVDATAQANRFATVNTQLIITQQDANDLAEKTDAVTEIVNQPDAVRLSLDGTAVAPQASGRYVWSRMAGAGALVVQDLAPLPTDKAYCLWLIYEGDWVLAGQFTVGEDGSGRLIVDDLNIPPDTGPLRAFAVSIEPTGDVTQHTGDTVLRAAMPE